MGTCAASAGGSRGRARVCRRSGSAGRRRAAAAAAAAAARARPTAAAAAAAAAGLYLLAVAGERPGTEADQRPPSPSLAIVAGDVGISRPGTPRN